MSKPGTNNDVHMRWALRRDMPEILAIEAASFKFPWSEDECIRCLRQRNNIAMVAECNKTQRVLGFVVYELGKDRLHILDFAVLPAARLQGVGRTMIDKLILKLNPQRRSRILLETRETNLDAQLFFKAMGFRAVSVLRDFYDDTTEDAIVFMFKAKAESKECAGR